MADQKTCFIIIPISTPEGVREKYRDGADHFTHVLECFTVKAVEAAGYTALPPIAEGADLIHAEIIKQLESADLVLCDMSSLNPNVFFEFGIRCALNKPVCIIKDDVTDKVPFDTGILNHLKYKSALEPWDLTTETDALVKHIQASASKCKGANPLWKYFGVKSEATPAKGGEGTQDKLDLLFMQMDAFRQELRTAIATGNETSSAKRTRNYASLQNDLHEWLFATLGKSHAIQRTRSSDTNRTVTVRCLNTPCGAEAANICKEAMEKFGYAVVFDNSSDNSSQDAPFAS